MAQPPQGLPISPLTGILDTRSLPNEIAPGGMRWRQNFSTTEEGKLCRSYGWEKFRSATAYNNQDLHDQLLTFNSLNLRQPPIFALELETRRKVRKFIVGTQSALFMLNEYSGNYRMLGSGYGTETVDANLYRWQHALLGDYLILTNNFNKVMYHALEETTNGEPAVQPIPDLDVIGITRAGVCWEWKNCIFLADVDIDGERQGYSLFWSDYANPLSFDPAKVESIAGTKDLFPQERILAGQPAGNSFLIYTTHGIWEMTAVGGTQSFAFRRVYNADANRHRCLAFQNTLVNLGDAHAYVGWENDRYHIYLFSQYYQRPEPVAWLDKGTGTLFENIDPNACNAHNAVSVGDEMFVSVAKIGDANHCPSQTLRAHMRFHVVGYIDHGFTCFGTYRPGFFQNIRDFFIDQRICTLAGLATHDITYDHEGLPAPFPAPSAAFAPQSIYTKNPLTIAGVTTEDYTQGTADSDSLCALLGNLRFDELCLKCEGKAVMVGASSRDWCLKQFTAVGYRERCANPTAVGTTGADGYASSVGSYLLDGYDSILRWPPGFGKDVMLTASAFKVDYIADPQDIPSNLKLRIGLSGQVGDPNTDECRIVWRSLSERPLKCLSPSTVAQHLANNTVPNLKAEWHFEYEARYIYFELQISGTGGLSCFSGVESMIAQQPYKNY